MIFSRPNARGIRVCGTVRSLGESGPKLFAFEICVALRALTNLQSRGSAVVWQPTTTQPPRLTAPPTEPYGPFDHPFGTSGRETQAGNVCALETGADGVREEGIRPPIERRWRSSRPLRCLVTSAFLFKTTLVR